MNAKLLILISFLTALLCHIFIFNSLVVIFPIDAETPKPKLFFLGPILKQSDISQSVLEYPAAKTSSDPDQLGSRANNAASMNYETTDPDKNPFTIKAIKKPLTPKTAKSEEKIILKSTFETQMEKDISKDVDLKQTKSELEIKPYKPLRFRAPKNTNPEMR